MKKLYYFYQIVCIDAKITDSYIGSTRYFKTRLIKHKSSCNNIKSRGYNFKLYQFIRSNGGWTNWLMFPIDVLETDCYVAVRKKEKELMKLHESTLNMINAYFDKKDYYETNKEKIKQRDGQKLNCECGGNYTHGNKAIHMRTIKHKSFLNKAINQFKIINKIIILKQMFKYDFFTIKLTME